MNKPEEKNINKKRTSLVSRNITVMGKRTSVRLEPEMWNSLQEIAKREQCKIHDLCSLISLRKNPDTSLTAAIRVFLMLYYRAASTEDGHIRAGHGNFKNMVTRASVPDDFISYFFDSSVRYEPRARKDLLSSAYHRGDRGVQRQGRGAS